AELFEARVQVADVRRAFDDALAIELQHQAQGGMGGRVLGTEVERPAIFRIGSGLIQQFRFGGSKCVRHESFQFKPSQRREANRVGGIIAVRDRCTRTENYPNIFLDPAPIPVYSAMATSAQRPRVCLWNGSHHAGRPSGCLASPASVVLNVCRRVQCSTWNSAWDREEPDPLHPGYTAHRHAATRVALG